MQERPFDVVIMGGGIVGCAIAWQLLRLDPNLRVILIEKGEIGSGSTSRSAAAFRHQFSSRGNILLSKASYEVYKDFDATFETGAKSFHENGYLFLYTSPALFAEAQERVAIQHREGIPTELLSPAEIDAKPALRGFFALDKIVGATFCARDGFLDPLLACQSFFKAARAKGLSHHRGQVLSFVRQGPRLTGLRTSAGLVEGKVFINAMGWSANRVLSQEGIPLPILPVKRYLYITTPVRGASVRQLPLIVCDLEPYMRPEAGNALLMGWDALPRMPAQDALNASHDFEELEAAQDHIDPEFTNDEYGLQIRIKMAEVFPLLESDQLRLQQESCGYYQISADEKPILDHDPRLEGLIHAIGYSGHGIMHAPSSALVIAGLVLGRETLPGIAPGTFALAPLLAHKTRPDPEHMSI